MKRLILSRHAKSSWNHPDLRDIDRPLNKRGFRASPVMGRELARLGYHPDVILASPSQRTRTTAELLAAELDFDPSEIQIVDSLYGASSGEVVAIANRLDDKINTALLIGHNPTWTNVINRFTGGCLMNLPTSGIAIIDFDVDHWAQVESGTQRDLLLPKDFGVGGGGGK
ncbi:MAG: SixA phosphatase family protein [Verrucomicrobiaceae bacterium]